MTVKTTTRSNLTPKDKAQQYLNTRAATELPKALQRIQHLEEQLADVKAENKKLQGADEQIASMKRLVDMAENHADRQKKIAEELSAKVMQTDETMRTTSEANATMSKMLKAERRDNNQLRVRNTALEAENDRLAERCRDLEQRGEPNHSERIRLLEADNRAMEGELTRRQQVIEALKRDILAATSGAQPAPAPHPQDTQPEAPQASNTREPRESAELIDPADARRMGMGMPAIGLKLHCDTMYDNSGAILGRIGGTRFIVDVKVRDDHGSGNASTKPRRCVDVVVSEAPQRDPI